MRFYPTEGKMAAIAVYLQNQVKDRFVTKGASGDHPWPRPKWRASMGHDDGRALLTGRTGSLLRSFHASATQQTASVGSPLRYAKVHQLGTVGKGGVLPDIKPKKAKALFIPLTDRAETSIAVRTGRLGERRRMATHDRKGQPIHTSGLSIAIGDLIPGKIVKGKIVPPNADFVFLKKSSIAPRPMLPNGSNERSEQTRFVTETLKS